MDNTFKIKVLRDLCDLTTFKKLSNLTLALCLFVACGSPKTEAPAAVETPPKVRVPVAAALLVRRSLTDKIVLNATTVYRRKINIRATATGFLHGLTAPPPSETNSLRA